MSISSFYEKHKLPILTTLAVVLAAAGYLIYTLSAEPVKPKKKTKKKNKKVNKKKAYPVDDQGKPAITLEYVALLSDAQRDEISVALKEAGNVHFKAKEYQDAIVYYTAALDVKETEVFYLNRSACYAALEDYENVVKDTTAALKIKPEYPKCLLRRLSAYEKLGRYDDAMFDLTALTFFGSEYPQNHVNSLLERNLKLLAERKVEEMGASKAHELPSAVLVSSFFTGFDKDQTLLDELRSKKPQEGSGEFYLEKMLENMILRTLEGFANADSYANQAAEALKDGDKKLETIALEYCGAFSFLKGDDEGSVKILERALSLQPRARTYVLRALTSSSALDPTQFFEAAERLEPNNFEVYYQRGQFCFLSDDVSGAKKYFEKLMELNDKNVYVWIQLACMKHTTGLKEESLKMFEEAKTKFPLSPEIPNYYGEILNAQGKTDEALEQFEVAYRLQGTTGAVSVGVLPLNLIGAIHMVKQDFDKAIEVFKKALAEDPKSEEACVSLGQLYLQKNNLEDAISFFERAALLSRSKEGKVSSISYAEAAKMQRRVSADPYMRKKMDEFMTRAAMQGV